jgi:hypothetical protein
VAEDVVAGPAAQPASERPATERPAPTRAERAHTSAYYTRFSLAYTLLIVLGVGVVGALVFVLINPSAKKGPPWSAFEPKGSALAMERQIATQVSAEYKDSTESRLVSVFPGPLQATQFVQGNSGTQSVQVPISLVAVLADASKGTHEEGDYSFFDPHSTVGYAMCGIGDSRQNCGVANTTGGSPEGLLRREGLELALYTLKYVPNTDAVIAYLPPPGDPGVAAKAILISRKDVKANLDLPLRQTLKPQQVVLGGGLPDGGHVGELTSSRIYTSNYQTLPSDGSSALVLTPAGTAG